MQRVTIGLADFYSTSLCPTAIAGKTSFRKLTCDRLDFSYKISVSQILTSLLLDWCTEPYISESCYSVSSSRLHRRFTISCQAYDTTKMRLRYSQRRIPYIHPFLQFDRRAQAPFRLHFRQSIISCKQIDAILIHADSFRSRMLCQRFMQTLRNAELKLPRIIV